MPTLNTNYVAPINEYAIVVDARDNVAVVKRETSPGLEIVLNGGRVIKIAAAVPPGHRFATRAILEGDFVLQYGQPIGTSLGIREGEQVTHANMSNAIPVVRELPADLYTAPPSYFPEHEWATFRGFRRPAGRVGTRNF